MLEVVKININNYRSSYHFSIYVKMWLEAM